MTGSTPRRPRAGAAALAVALLAGLAGLNACSSGDHPKDAPTSSTSSPAASGSNDAGPKQGEGMTALGTMLGDTLSLRDGGSFGDDRLTVHASAGTPFSAYAQVSYPKGSASQKVSRDDGRPDGGAQSYWQLRSGPLDDAYLRYWVWFPAGFDFVKGGKMPGLYGGTQTSGGKIPDGEDGLSTRYMWRTGGAGEVYAYLPTSKEHGTSLGRGDWTWPTGRWACVEQHVHLNAPSAKDGSVTVWLDGKQVLDQQGMEYRTAADLRIEGLFFSTFFGGGDPSWATPTDQIARFGGFRIATSRIGCG